jgi:hypothetical protein
MDAYSASSCSPIEQPKIKPEITDVKSKIKKKKVIKT